MDFLIVGLGNPGEKYRLTRHNAGFLVVDKLASLYNQKITNNTGKALVGFVKSRDINFILAKPTTFMNLSGDAVYLLMNKYSIPLSRVIIVFDDLSIPFGTIRLRGQGSSGGHKGLSSVITYTGDKVVRLRVGIGTPSEDKKIVDYVLNPFAIDEQKVLSEILTWAGEAVISWAQEGLEKAMSLYNGQVPNIQ